MIISVNLLLVVKKEEVQYLNMHICFIRNLVLHVTTMQLYIYTQQCNYTSLFYRVLLDVTFPSKEQDS